mgnify:CR=1 FL=1
MTFRIIEHRKYDKVYFYIQQYYSHFFGLWQGWSTLKEEVTGDPNYPDTIEVIKFSTQEEAEEYIRRTYTKPIEVVEKKIEI